MPFANPDDQREWRRGYNEANKERIKARKAAYHQATKAARSEHARQYYLDNREVIKARVALHATANRDKVLAYGRAYGLANSEARDARAKQWRIDNPEAAKEHARRGSATRRARKLNAFIEVVDAQTVYKMHGGMCGICKQFIEGDFHVDHVIPLSKGGLHGYVNVQPAHPRCNLVKGAR